jgi:hypothetical protein
MALFRRHKSFSAWTPAEIAGDVERAFVGDPEQPYLRAAVVLRSAPERLPAADAKKWADEASAENGGRGVPPYLIYKFGCADGDRERMYLEGDNVALLVREVDVAFDLTAAVALAREWTGEKTMEAAKFAHIPGVYQAALIEALTGTRRSWESYLFSYWCWPSEEGSQFAIVRPYPPRGVKSDEVSPEEEAAGVMADDHAALMPADIIDHEYQRLLNSQTWDSVFRKSGI